MIIRWSAWNLTVRSCELLRHSVAGFTRAFGPAARYIIFTSDPRFLRDQIGYGPEVFAYDAFPDREFDVDSVAPWRKWCPTARFAPGETELFVDSDIFLVGDPVELRDFCRQNAAESYVYLAMQEALPARWTLGRLEPRVPWDAPPINAGLLGQLGDADIRPALRREFDWWKANVVPSAATAHDEQGALVAALSREGARLALLPERRYRIVSPRSNSSVRDPKDLALVHATYPEHPAFDLFRNAIEAYIEAT